MVCKSILHMQMAEKLAVEVNCFDGNRQMGWNGTESVGVLRDTTTTMITSRAATIKPVLLVLLHYYVALPKYPHYCLVSRPMWMGWN